MLIFMSLSLPGKSGLQAASTDSALAEPGPGRTIFRKSLYRRTGYFVIVVFVLWALAVPRGQGQEERPQIVPQRTRPQENKKAKKVKEPRAVGILQFDSSGKETLIPIAILFDGKFYDASAYKADPIPMALESGTVYEAEQSGVPDGLFTINGALQSKSSNSPHTWMGTGTYLPPGAEAAKTTRKAEDVPVGLGSSSGDEPPRLTRSGSKSTGKSDSGSPAGTSGSGSGQKPAESAPGAAQPGSGASEGPASGSASGQDKTKSEKPASSDKPGDAGAKQPAGAPQPSADEGSNRPSSSAGEQSDGDYYRPQLRRGKPTAPAPPDADDKVAVTKPSGGTEPELGAKIAGATPVRVEAAVSDAAGPDPQSYKFFWKTGEEEERRNQMLSMAALEVRAYAAALVRNQIPARPVIPKATAGARNAQTRAQTKTQPVFENIQFRGYDLWLTSQPVMILSAEAHIPVAPGGSVAAAEPYSVMLVARTDIYGDLRKLYAGVTDRFHLDVTPRLELIDTVDADGDGRGELLFRETTDAGNGYVIYRATADKLWKMFDSLNAE
jgi:hypothetical protein